MLLLKDYLVKIVKQDSAQVSIHLQSHQLKLIFHVLHVKEKAAQTYVMIKDNYKDCNILKKWLSNE